MNARSDALRGLFDNRIGAGVLAFLSDRGVGDFTELALALGIANNALSAQLYRLEGAGYVLLEKGFLGRRPRTQVRLTPEGQAAWASHLEVLEGHLSQPSVSNAAPDSVPR